jgi:hypothetical protein
MRARGAGLGTFQHCLPRQAPTRAPPPPTHTHTNTLTGQRLGCGRRPPPCAGPRRGTRCRAIAPRWTPAAAGWPTPSCSAARSARPARGWCSRPAGGGGGGGAMRVAEGPCHGALHPGTGSGCPGGSGRRLPDGACGRLTRQRHGCSAQRAAGGGAAAGRGRRQRQAACAAAP